MSEMQCNVILYQFYNSKSENYKWNYLNTDSYTDINQIGDLFNSKRILNQIGWVFRL